MDQMANAPQNRIVFFDNLRYLMVALVILLHSGASCGTGSYLAELWDQQICSQAIPSLGSDWAGCLECVARCGHLTTENIQWLMRIPSF